MLSSRRSSFRGVANRLMSPYSWHTPIAASPNCNACSSYGYKTQAVLSSASRFFVGASRIPQTMTSKAATEFNGSSTLQQRPLTTINATAAMPSANAVSPNKRKTQPSELSFKPFPFIKEDIQKVATEIPDFKYYYFGDEDVQQNIYANIPLDQSIPLTRDLAVEASPRSNQLEFSQLENGLRIASIDKGGLTCSLGLFVHAGSRFETHSNFGVTHMIENSAFRSTAHLSWLRTIKTLETMGVNAQCNIGREITVYFAEGLRNTMPIVVPILTGNILFPRFLPWELKDNAKRLSSTTESLDKNVDALITELLHKTAWHNNTLGHSLYASEDALAYYNGDTMRDFMLQHFSPANMVFVGVNVNHNELCKWLMRSFVDYNAIPNQPREKVKAVYTGGDCRHSGGSKLANLAIAFEIENGWSSEDLVAVSVLRLLVGGGGSFSTGGPGKGMYTQLFLNVLHRYDWVDTCTAFDMQYTDSGLFGIYMAANPLQGAAMVSVIAEEFNKMGQVSEAGLKRAKNAVKASLWMNLEFRPVIMEDVGRQLIMSDKFWNAAELSAAIDNITASDIARVVKKLTSTRPTVVACGDVSTIPHYDQIVQVLDTMKG